MNLSLLPFPLYGTENAGHSTKNFGDKTTKNEEKSSATPEEQQIRNYIQNIESPQGMKNHKVQFM